MPFSAISIGLWLVKSTVGRIVLAAILGGIGWASFATYYKYQGRQQVYEQIKEDTKEAKERRNAVDEDTGSLDDNELRDRLQRDSVGE